MTSDVEAQLHAYAELTVKIAVNLQPGQRLLIVGALANGGAPLEAAPLVRHIAASAYDAGAPLVETIWGDEGLQLARFGHAPRRSFDEYSAWFPAALVEHVEAGHAVLSVYANDPDLLRDQSADLVSAVQQSTSQAVRPFREHISRNATNWAVIAAPSPRWAAKVFPHAPSDEGVARLWDAIRRLCRLDHASPIEAWAAHLDRLAQTSEYLNHRRYQALRYSGPGTDLTLGLPGGHLWVSGRSTSRSGIVFTANLPTEEVFTIAHRDVAEGVVRSTKPLSYGGTLVDDFSLRFSGGRVVEARAQQGEAVLRRLLDTDPGASRLGEIALVPGSSPVAQSGVLFYNTLFDENAASHVALGTAYKFTLEGGDRMDDEEFARAGGNQSGVHVDFMIGSAELDVDGVLPGGTTEPVMRQGEWAFRA